MYLGPKPNPIQKFWNVYVPMLAGLWVFVAGFSALFSLIGWYHGHKSTHRFFGWAWEWNQDSLWSQILAFQDHWFAWLLMLWWLVYGHVMFALLGWVAWDEYHEDKEPITHEQAEYNRERYYYDYDYHHEDSRTFSYYVFVGTTIVLYAYWAGYLPFPLLKS